MMQRKISIFFSFLSCSALSISALLFGCGSGGTSTGTVEGDIAADTSTCGPQTSCKNANGQESAQLCGDLTKFECVAGCCQTKFTCKVDADCATRLGTDPKCSDKRFTCVCDTSTGLCAQSACGSDVDCATGLQCHQGGCIAALADGDLNARLLRPYWIGNVAGEFDAAAGLGAQAYDGKGNVKAEAAFEWTMAANDAFTLTDGKLKATDKAGKATITAKVKGSSKAASNPATLWNMGPIPQGKTLRVTAVDDQTFAPLTGKVVVIGLAHAVTPEAAKTVELTDGSALFADVTWPADIHVLAKGHTTTSVLRHPGGKAVDVVLPSAQYFLAKVEMDENGALVTEKKLDKNGKQIFDGSKFVNADLLVGKIAYSGDGEAALGLTSVGLGPSLMNFNLDAVLGPSVARAFDKDTLPIINSKPGEPTDVPGGVTFGLGKPVLSAYVLAAPPGKHTLWSLAGHVDLNDLLAQVGSIVSAVADGNDVISKVVSALLPYLGGIYSQVVFDVPFADTVTTPTHKLDLAPTVPLLHKIDVTMPDLPVIGKDATDKPIWADIAFVIGGAMLPSGEIIPLGLSAGADQNEDTDPKDGKIDGDSKVPGNQPTRLAIAPLHGGVRYGKANHTFVSAAVIAAGKGKKEGASLQITEPSMVAKTLVLEPYLPFGLGSAYDPATTTLKGKTVAGAQFYRVQVLGQDNHQWQLVIPSEEIEKPLTLPDLTQLGGEVNLAKNVKRLFVSAFELRKALAFSDVLGPKGLVDLELLVKRTSFIDANP